MGIFYNLGKWAGPKVRKGKWVWTSMTGDEAEILAAEAEVGADLASAMLDQLGRCEDPAMRKLVASIGAKIAPRVANKNRKFVYHAVETDEPNAFALPGGYVLISRPLIELTGANADEIAFVLAHEMAHVIKRDPMQRIMTDAALNSAMRVTPLRGVVGGWIKSHGLTLLKSAYSQEAELMADKLGTRLAQAAGYDARAGIRMLKRLKEFTGAPDGQPLGSYFQSHPPFDVRTAAIDAYLRGRG